MENNEQNCCNCSSNSSINDLNCNYMPEGINAAFGYNPTSIMDNLNCSCEVNNSECLNNRNEIREKMMKNIKCLNFAVIEISEYLDTHPNDQKAICLHKEYSNKLNELENKYQKVFGPLTIYFPCNKWRWLEEPWPWERSDF